jgi:hypothetical protein
MRYRPSSSEPPDVHALLLDAEDEGTRWDCPACGVTVVGDTMKALATGIAVHFAKFCGRGADDAE